MQIKVTFHGSFTVFNPEDSGAFLKALANSQTIESTGWGDSEKFKLSKNKPTIELVDSIQLEELPTPLVELQTQLRASESRWLEYYNKANKLEKEKKELEEKLANIKATTEQA